MEKWFVTLKKGDFERWAQEFSISPVLARIIRNRDLMEDGEVKRYLYGGLKDCYSPWLLHHCEEAVLIILEHIKAGAYIRVIGDYDVDGICSSFILAKGLKELGAKVDTVIPHRIHDGYGLNESLILAAKQDGVDLIITCDNGIAAAPQIQMARDAGIGVVVTDHHEVPFTEEEGKRRELLPPALAVVDPKQEACSYPFPNICGGVVAYKLIQALLEKTGNRKLEGVMDELLQFAALATVCDVMELKDENRIIVKEGLKRLKTTENLGLKALMEVNGIEPGKLSAYHLGFVIGPCLNATGRLDTAGRALELLETTVRTEAMSGAAQLKELNDSRKNLTLQGVEQALKYIDDHMIHKDKVMIVYLPKVHESLAGIIAGRIREKYNRPVFVLTKSEEGIKGSGRSIEAYHMFDSMTEVKELFTKYGGHRLAAGLSLDMGDWSERGIHAADVPEELRTEEGKVDALRKELNERCRLTEEDFIPRVQIDVPMPLDYADKELAKSLELLEPFGVSNPKPLFAQKELRFMKGWKMGAKQNFARFRVRTPEGKEQELVFFGDLERFCGFLDEKYGEGCGDRMFSESCNYVMSVTYQLGVNSYRGNESVQFVMQNYC